MDGMVWQVCASGASVAFYINNLGVKIKSLRYG